MSEPTTPAGTGPWRHPDAMQRLDELFGAETPDDRLSPVFTGKYQRWFGQGAPRLSRRLARRRRRLERLIGQGTLDGARVLDTGTGFGFNALLAALAGAREVLAVDLREDRIDDLRVLASIAGLPTLEAECAPYQAPTRDRGPFDLIIASYFLSHLDSDDEFLDLCTNALAPGGMLHIADDNNALSPSRQASVRAEWWRAEFVGNRDNPDGFLAVRRAAIENELGATAGMKRWMLREYCAWAARGMMLQDCRALARHYVDRSVPRPPRPPFAYRDPGNGIAEERLLNPLGIAAKLRARGLEVTLFPPRAGHGADRISRAVAAVSPEFELLATRPL